MDFTWKLSSSITEVNETEVIIFLTTCFVLK